MEEAKFSVGKVASRCDVKVSTLHFYEEKGLIRSWRNTGNQRRYKKDVFRRVAVIKAAQKVGVSLDNIMQAFESLPEKRTPNSDDWEVLSKNWKKALENRILQLENLRDSLSGCIGCGCLSMKSCPMYNKEDMLGKNESGAVLLNRKNQDSSEN